MMIDYYKDNSQDNISPKEFELYQLIMAYRASLGLPSIPLSKSLSVVAARHALDTVENMGTYSGHAWSDAPYNSADSGTWANMWAAPQRVGTAYAGNGYEITMGYSGTSVVRFEVTAAEALEGWQGSPGHNNVIVNAAPWGQAWSAIGVGMYKGIAHVWFGHANDPAGRAIIDGANNIATLNGVGNFDIYQAGSARGQFQLTASASSVKLASDTHEVTLNGYERVVFSDGILAFDFNGAAGQAYRLYQAAFDRVPDTAGLSYWIREMDKGVSLKAVADSFLASPEFTSTYGTPQTVSNGRYVELLYTHTLGRNYDQSGYNYWVNRLDTNATNRTDLLAFFSESDENQARVAGAIDDGIWYT